MRRSLSRVLLVAALAVPWTGPIAAGDGTDAHAGEAWAERARAEILFSRGQLAWADADSVRAEALFLEAAEAWPSNATYAFFAGRVALARNEAARAAALFSSALPPQRSQIEEWRVEFETGRASYRAGDEAAAEKHLRRTLALKPDDAGAMFHLGFVLLERGDCAEAAALFTQAREIAPELSADSHYYVGIARLCTGDESGAEDEFEQVLEHATRRVRNSIPEIVADTREYLALLRETGGGR